jgi:hypothetical protein
MARLPPTRIGTLALATALTLLCISEGVRASEAPIPVIGTVAHPRAGDEIVCKRLCRRRLATRLAPGVSTRAEWSPSRESQQALEGRPTGRQQERTGP